ncbi:hypothetical protein [Paenibacillus kyungheensis]
MIKHTITLKLKSVRFEPLTLEDIKFFTKETGWTFEEEDWKKYFGISNVYPVKIMLTDSDRIEGVIVYEEKYDINGLFILWMESASHNRSYKGSGKREFDYISENLLAYVCKKSKHLNYNFVALQSKGNPVLDNFYLKLGFKRFPFNRYMGIEDASLKKLISIYYN